MRTTIDLPDPLFKAAKLEAVHQGTSLKELITEALKLRLAHSATDSPGTSCVRVPKMTAAEWSARRDRILARMEQGYPLGGKPLTREQIYDRPAVR
jgi:hypothetical protein